MLHFNKTYLLQNYAVFQEKEEKMKLKMKNNFDSRHRAQTLPPLHSGDTVWLPNEDTEASVLEKVGPRSYTVATPKGTLQRNRSQIRPMPHSDQACRSRSGQSGHGRTSFQLYHRHTSRFWMLGDSLLVPAATMVKPDHVALRPTSTSAC